MRSSLSSCVGLSLAVLISLITAFAQDVAPTISINEPQTGSGVVLPHTSKTIELQADGGSAEEPDFDAQCPPWVAQNTAYKWDYSTLVGDKTSGTEDASGLLKLNRDVTGEASVTVEFVQYWEDSEGNQTGTTTSSQISNPKDVKVEEPYFMEYESNAVDDDNTGAVKTIKVKNNNTEDMEVPDGKLDVYEQVKYQGKIGFKVEIRNSAGTVLWTSDQGVAAVTMPNIKRDDVSWMKITKPNADGVTGSKFKDRLGLSAGESLEDLGDDIEDLWQASKAGVIAYLKGQYLQQKGSAVPAGATFLMKDAALLIVPSKHDYQLRAKDENDSDKGPWPSSGSFSDLKRFIIKFKNNETDPETEPDLEHSETKLDDAGN